MIEIKGEHYAGKVFDEDAYNFIEDYRKRRGLTKSKFVTEALTIWAHNQVGKPIIPAQLVEPVIEQSKSTVLPFQKQSEQIVDDTPTTAVEPVVDSPVLEQETVTAPVVEEPVEIGKAVVEDDIPLYNDLTGVDLSGENTSSDYDDIKRQIEEEVMKRLQRRETPTISDLQSEARIHRLQDSHYKHTPDGYDNQQGVVDLIAEEPSGDAFNDDFDNQKDQVFISNDDENDDGGSFYISDEYEDDESDYVYLESS